MFLRAAKQAPRDGLLRQCIFEPGMHLVTDVFAVSQTILNEGDFVTGEKIEIAAPLFLDLCDLGAITSHVAAMPEGGSEGVGVADQNTIGVAGCDVFAALLFTGDHCKLLCSPHGVVLREFDFGIFAAEFLDPGCLQGLGKCLGEGGRAGGFRTQDADALREPGAHGQFQIVPVSEGIGADRRGGDGNGGARLVDADVFCAHQFRVTVAVTFGCKHDVGSAADPAHRVLGPDARVVFVVAIIDQHDFGGRMSFLEPCLAESAWNSVGGSLTHDDDDAVAA